MQRLFIVLFVSVLFLSCGEDEPVIVQEDPKINFDRFSYDIGEITPSSVIVRFISNSVSGTGGQLIREIWYKKSNDSEWSKKDITDGALQQSHVLDGLENATKYNIKPVFSIGDLVKEGSERTISTLPFQYFSRGYSNEKALIWTRDSKDEIDFRALDPEPSFFLKFEADSLEMAYTAISKDSLITSLESNTSQFFESNEEYVEKIEASVSLRLNDFYDEKVTELDIYNKKPKIDSVYYQTVVSCDDYDVLKLLFRGNFWSAIYDNKDTLFNVPNDYNISIKNKQDPSISSPVYTRSELRENKPGITTSCESDISIIEDVPIENNFHRGRFLWVSMPKDLFPEGDYILHFSAVKNDETYTAEPLEFELLYE